MVNRIGQNRDQPTYNMGGWNPEELQQFENRFISQFYSILAGIGVCLVGSIAKNHLPSFDFKLHFPWSINKYGQTICQLNLATAQFFDLSRPQAIAISVPVVEELIFRVILQEGILKHIPRKILNKISPKHAHLFDTKMAQISRVVFSAAAFSLSHVDHEGPIPSHTASYLIHTFVVGLIAGVLQEKTGDPLMPIRFHIGHNLLGAIKTPNYIMFCRDV